MAVMPGTVYIDEWGQKAPPAIYTPSGAAAPSGSGTTGTASAPAPTPAPAAAPGSISLGGGYNPDYGALIQSDPAYLAAQAAAEKAKGDAAATRKQSLQQALIQYGGLPANFNDQYGDIDQATKDLAAGNQFSVLANLAKNYAQSTDQFKRGLAARGALQSGDLGYGLDQLEQGYGQQKYDAANQFGSQINNVLGQYNGVINGNAQAMASAIQGAESNVYSNPAYRPSAPSTANYDAANSSAYGQPIYVDSSGNLFDQQGNPFSPGGGGAPSPSAAPSDAGGGASSGDVYFNPATGQQTDYRPYVAPGSVWLT